MGPQSARSGSGCHPRFPGCRGSHPGSGSRWRPGTRDPDTGRRPPVPAASPQAGLSTTYPAQPRCRQPAAGHWPGSRQARCRGRDRTGLSRRPSGRLCIPDSSWPRPPAGQADTGMRAAARVRVRVRAPCARPEPGWGSRLAGSCPHSCRTGYPGPPPLRVPRSRRSAHCPSPGPGRPGWLDSPCWPPGPAAGWPAPGAGGPDGSRNCAAVPGWSASRGRSVTSRGRCAGRPGPGGTHPGRCDQTGWPDSRACRWTPGSPGRRRAYLDRTHSRRMGRGTADRRYPPRPGSRGPGRGNCPGRGRARCCGPDRLGW